MRNFYLLFASVTLFAMSAFAQADFDYYIGSDNPDTRSIGGKIFFQYIDNAYVANIKKIDSDFKIYSLNYNPDATGQDNLVFGAADGQPQLLPKSTIKLDNPGNPISIGNTGALYEAKLIFDPAAKTLKVDGGSSIVTRSTLELEILSCTGTSPEAGQITFALQYIKTATAAVPKEFVVTAHYTDNAGDYTQQEIVVTPDNMTGTFTITDIKPGILNHVLLDAKAIVSGQTITDTAIAPLITPVLPYLVGDIAGHQWQADYGIPGTQFRKIADGNTYYYEVNLTGEGKFNFVTALGANATDWDTVYKSLSYAPSSSSVAAPEKTWMPYSTFDTGGTRNAWYPSDFTPGTYIVEFNYTTRSIAVVKGDVPTDTPLVETEAAPATADVYSISGIIVRKDVPAAEATTGLPAGLYIVNGKKIAVR